MPLIKRTIAIVVSIFCLLLTAHTVVVNGESTGINDNSNTCYGLDIVILIDQNRSINGRQYLTANDPLKYRKTATELVADLLAQDILSNCPDVTHRIGVIGFAIDTKVYLPLSELNLETYNDPNSTISKLPDLVITEELGDANYYYAFQDAEEMLHEANAIGMYPRKNMILMITDGTIEIPSKYRTYDDVRDYRASFSSNLVRQANNYFPFAESMKTRDEELHQAILLYGSFERIPSTEIIRIIGDTPVTMDDLQNSYYFNILTINAERDFYNEMEDALEEIADDHSGEVIQLEGSYLQTLEHLEEMLSIALLHPVNDHFCGPYYVSPYTNTLTLDIYKQSVGIQINLITDEKEIQAGGETYGGTGDNAFWGVTEYSSYGSAEHWLFENPPIGEWWVETDLCGELWLPESLSDVFPYQVDITEPDYYPLYSFNDESLYDPDQPQQFSFSQDDFNFENNPQYPLIIEGEIESPSGNQYPMDCIYDESAEAWISGNIPVNEEGIYQYTYIGTADCINDQLELCENGRFTVVEGTGIYEVVPVEMLHFEIQPQENFDETIHREDFPLSFAIIVSNEENNVVPAESWRLPTWGKEQTFKAIMIDPQNHQSDVDITTQIGDSGYEYGVKVDEGDITGEGRYQVVVTANDVWKHNEYHMTNRIDTFEFEIAAEHDQRLWPWILLSGCIVVGAGIVVYLLRKKESDPAKKNNKLKNR